MRDAMDLPEKLKNAIHIRNHFTKSEVDTLVVAILLHKMDNDNYFAFEMFRKKKIENKEALNETFD